MSGPEIFRICRKHDGLYQSLDVTWAAFLSETRLRASLRYKIGNWRKVCGRCYSESCPLSVSHLRLSPFPHELHTPPSPTNPIRDSRISVFDNFHLNFTCLRLWPCPPELYTSPIISTIISYTVSSGWLLEFTHLRTNVSDISLYWSAQACRHLHRGRQVTVLHMSQVAGTSCWEQCS